MPIAKSRRTGVIMATVSVAVFFSGGCMTGKSEINDPLPVMSQRGAEDWAQHFTESMARTAKVEIDKKMTKPAFGKCVGKNDEVAEDGRFDLMYTARAPLDASEHLRAVKRIKEELEDRGYKIDAYQVTKGADGSVLLDASDPKKGFRLSIDAYGQDDLLTLTVSTPCLLPPGKKQQQY